MNIHNHEVFTAEQALSVTFALSSSLSNWCENRFSMTQSSLQSNQKCVRYLLSDLDSTVTWQWGFCWGSAHLTSLQGKWPVVCAEVARPWLPVWCCNQVQASIGCRFRLIFYIVKWTLIWNSLCSTWHSCLTYCYLKRFTLLISVKGFLSYMVSILALDNPSVIPECNV